jgi:hypothetical protein
MQAIPTFVPTIALEGATQIQDAFAASFGPKHAGVFETLADDGAASGLHDPRSAEQPGLVACFVQHAAKA